MDTGAQDDLIRIVALAQFSYEFEDVEPGIADQAWQIACEHAERQGIDPTEAVFQIDW